MDELELRPIDDTETDIAPAQVPPPAPRAKAPARKPAPKSRPVIVPANESQASLAMNPNGAPVTDGLVLQEVQPSASGTHAMPVISIPVRPISIRRSESKSSSSTLAIVAVGLLCFGAGAYFFGGSKSSTPAAVATPTETTAPAAPSTPAAPVQIAPVTIAPVKVTIPTAKTNAAKAESSEAKLQLDADRVGLAHPDGGEAPAAAAPEALAPVAEAAPAAPVSPIPVPTARKVVDDDEDLEAEQAVKAARRKAELAGKKVNPANDAPKGLDAALKKKEEPVAAAPEKKSDKPGAPVLTATEPTVLPIDLQKLDGADADLTTNIQGVLPNWKVRDANRELSVLSGVEHRGRSNVVVLNPINPVLPAKLIATIEVPVAFAGKRPMLAMEVSTKDYVKDWTLGVKVNGRDVMTKNVIKTTKKDEWADRVVDMSMFAGKQVEVVIEFHANIAAKQAKATKDELAYVRNIRFEWPSKKK